MSKELTILDADSFMGQIDVSASHCKTLLNYLMNDFANGEFDEKAILKFRVEYSDFTNLLEMTFLQICEISDTIEKWNELLNAHLEQKKQAG